MNSVWTTKSSKDKTSKPFFLRLRDYPRMATAMQLADVPYAISIYESGEPVNVKRDDRFRNRPWAKFVDSYCTEAFDIDGIIQVLTDIARLLN